MPIVHASVPTVTSASDVLQALAHHEIRFEHASVVADESAFLDEPPLASAPLAFRTGETAIALRARATVAPTRGGLIASGPLREALDAEDGRSLAASLVALGLDERAARAMEESVRRGGVLVLVAVAADDVGRAQELLSRAASPGLPRPSDLRATVADAPQSLRARPSPRRAEPAHEWPRTVWEKLRMTS